MTSYLHGVVTFKGGLNGATIALARGVIEATLGYQSSLDYTVNGNTVTVLLSTGVELCSRDAETALRWVYFSLWHLGLNPGVDAAIHSLADCGVDRLVSLGPAFTGYVFWRDVVTAG